MKVQLYSSIKEYMLTLGRDLSFADRNDPTRFQGEGINFNAKLIGVDDVPEPRGDKMCQDTICRLKISVKASGQHKQRIIVNVSEEGIKLVDLRTGVNRYLYFLILFWYSFHSFY